MKKERIKDFRMMVKEILPTRVQLPDELIDEITNNIEKAGSAENILHWSPGQYDLAYFCNNRYREILASTYSTGKTILMEHCALELLKNGENVLFILYHPNDQHLAPKSFLQMKMEKTFEIEYE